MPQFFSYRLSLLPAGLWKRYLQHLIFRQNYNYSFRLLFGFFTDPDTKLLERMFITLKIAYI